MAAITYGARRIELEAGETVLGGLLRAGIPHPSSCRAGTCQACLMRCTGGALPPAAQAGLKEALRAQGYFLPCVCRPAEDLAIAGAEDAGLWCEATIAGVERLSQSVVRLRLRPERPLEYRAGQFISLARGELIRSYSLASLPGRDELLELHVRELPGGRMSGWLCREAREEERLRLRGPAGECFYLPGDPGRPLLLVGTGTGLAPLYAILQDALRSGHTGEIALFHGAVAAEGLYLVEELLALSRELPNLRYTRCLLRGEREPGVEVGDLKQIVKSYAPSLKGWRVYLCGDPELVQGLKRGAFLAGAAMKEIHSDPFITAPST
jgi:CDP-4-dehydro-6-deoxyglucose reductase, E3